MQPPCHHCDQPDVSLLRLVLIEEILWADETQLALLTDLVQQYGLLHLSHKVKTPHVRRGQGTVYMFRRPDADQQ